MSWRNCHRTTKTSPQLHIHTGSTPPRRQGHQQPIGRRNIVLHRIIDETSRPGTIGIDRPGPDPDSTHAAPGLEHRISLDAPPSTPHRYAGVVHRNAAHPWARAACRGDTAFILEGASRRLVLESLLPSRIGRLLVLEHQIRNSLNSQSKIRHRLRQLLRIVEGVVDGPFPVLLGPQLEGIELADPHAVAVEVGEIAHPAGNEQTPVAVN